MGGIFGRINDRENFAVGEALVACFKILPKLVASWWQCLSSITRAFLNVAVVGFAWP
jgi:hypothetical protein